LLIIYIFGQEIRKIVFKKWTFIACLLENALILCNPHNIVCITAFKNKEENSVSPIKFFARKTPKK